MTSPALPLGAATPDELFVVYLNGSLSPEERRVVERWLAEHPEHEGHLELLRAL